MLIVAIVIAVASVLIAYGRLRANSVHRFKDELTPFLPPENYLGWRLPEKRTVILDSTQLTTRPSSANGDANHASTIPPIEFSSHAHDFDPGTINWIGAISFSAAAIDGMVQVAPLIVQFDKINVGALEHAFGKTIDLILKTDSLGFHFEHLSVAAEHGQEAWLGAIAAHLVKHMVHSTFENAATLKASVADMSHHAGVSAAEAHHGLAEGVLHGASAGEHIGFFADAHFPVVTVLFSGYREFKLLTDDKTTFLRAATHVAVDGAAVAGGGLLGAKAGAIAGSFFAPGIGTIIGGIVGGIGGSVAGKFGATAARFAPFEHAKSTYLSTADQAKKDIDSLIQRSQRETKRMQENGSRDFEQGRAALIQHARERLSAEVARCQSRVYALTEAFPERLDQLARQLDFERSAILENIPASRFAFLWPKRSDVMRTLVNQWFRRASDLIAAEITLYQALPKQSTSGRATEIRRFLAAYHFQLDQLDTDIRQVLDTIDHSRDQAKVIEAETLTKVESLRQRLIHQFTASIAKMTESIARETERRKTEIQQLWASLKVEADAVGISLPSEAG